MSFDLEKLFQSWPTIINLNEQDFLAEYDKLDSRVKNLIFKDEALVIYREVQRNRAKVNTMSDSQMRSYLTNLYLKVDFLPRN